jgi:hypothetical protein
MYVQECLARDRHQERLRQAQDQQSAQQVSELRKLKRRQRRAERDLVRAGQRVEQLRSALRVVS